MTSYIGLYYPFTHFRDEAWLKLTALYWDKMARIVPQGYLLHDSDTVKRSVGELDFIRNYSPAGETIALGETFLRLLQQHESALRRRYDVSQRAQWPDNPETLGREPPGSDPKLTYLFFEKMSPELLDALAATRLALPERLGDPRWVGMHPKLADVYRTALAAEMASALRLYPLADKTLNQEEQRAVEAWLPTRSPEEARQYVVTVFHPRSSEPLLVTVAEEKGHETFML